MPCTATSCRACRSRRAWRVITRMARSARMRSAMSARSARTTSTRLDKERYFGTGVIGKTGIERAYEDELLGNSGFREVLVNAEGRRVDAAGRQGRPAAKPPAAGRPRPAARARHRAAARRRGGDGRPARRGGRDRPVEWRRAGAREPARLRSERLRARHLAQGIPRADRRPGPAAVQPRAARHLPARVDDQADHGARRPRVRSHHARRTRSSAPGIFRCPHSRHRFRDWKREGHGIVDMRNAVMQSCDVYFYRLANTLGIDRIHDIMTPDRIRRADRHRHRRRTRRHHAVAAMEEDGVQPHANSRSGFPARP